MPYIKGVLNIQKSQKSQILCYQIKLNTHCHFKFQQYMWSCLFFWFGVMFFNGFIINIYINLQSQYFYQKNPTKQGNTQPSLHYFYFLLL